MSATAPAASSRARIWARRVLRWFIAPVFALFFATAAGLYLVCTFKSEIITSALEQQLRATTGLPWQIRGALTPKLFPYPGFSVQTVRVLAASTAQELSARDLPPLASVERLHVLLDFSALLGGSLQLHLVELEKADITFAYDRNGNPLWIPLVPAADPGADDGMAPAALESVPGAEQDNATADGTLQGIPATSSTAPAEADSLPVSARTGSAGGNNTQAAPAEGEATGGNAQDAALSGRISPQEQTRHALQSLNDFFAQGEYEYLPKLLIRDGTFTLLDESGKVDLALQNLDMRFRPAEPERILEYDAAFVLPPAGLEVRFSCTMALELAPVALNGRLEGRLSMEPPGSRAATGRFGSSVLWDGGDALIRLPDFRFDAEGDSLSAALALDLVEEAYHGTVDVHTFSLPRWFKFGRNLPPGLQEPLHTLSGSMEVYGTDSMVEGRNMRFFAGGLEILGNIACPDYSAPEVLVDLSIETANLDLVFPFLTAPGTVVPEPVEPEFTMSHLVPYPGLDEDEGPDVGYDVRIHVARPLVHQLTPGPLEVRVFPVLDSEIRPTPTRITFTDDELLEGKIHGWLDVMRGKVKMHYELDAVRLLDLPENKGNSVTVDGRVSGVADIDIDVDADSHWADNWQMRIDARADGLKIMGGQGASAWWITFGSTTAKGSGPIYTVRREGMRISGDWDFALGNVHSSWHPKGKDSINGRFSGALAWLPVKPEEENNMHRRRGVERVFGDISGTGQLIVPLGSERVPVKGKMSGKAIWNLHADTMALSEMAFDGLGSFVGGSVHIDASGKEVKVAAPLNFKLAPRVLLKAWDLLPSGGIQMPATLTGTTSVNSEGTTVRFTQLKAQVDGDPLEGSITGSGGQTVPGAKSAEAEKGSHWVFRLNSSRLNLDTFFPPSTPEEKKKAPSREPWNLSFLSNLSIDAELVAEKAKFHGANLVDTKIVAALQRGRFSLQVLTGDFYGGTSTLLAQGTFVPERSQMNISRMLGEMKNFSLGRALQDLTQDNSYGGKSDIIFDFSGTMQSNADLYAGLSGIWSMKISDGVYPAFVGSETAGLRNTFSTASSSGVMEKGVLKSDNFQLKGMMVDMYGQGWVDLVRDVMDLEIYVTLAKVPTFPVRLHGDLTAPSMTLRGAHMVVHTAQAAGSTVFSLIRGVLELPGRAVRAIGGE